MKTKPNTVLPEGGRLITPAKLRLGRWVEMKYDATVKRAGVDWFRVKNGMGDRGDREDWCADIPGVSVAVHDYHWNGEDFGPSYGSFDAAVAGQLTFASQCLRERIADLKRQLESAEEGLLQTERALEKLEVPA